LRAYIPRDFPEIEEWRTTLRRRLDRQGMRRI